jgi:hypothetical protein
MEKPGSKMALIRYAWPRIMAALTAGHSLKRVCERLNADGIAVEYNAFRAYVSILRRQQTERSVPVQDRQARSAPVPVVHVLLRPVPATARPNLSDPMATAMEYLNRVRGFQSFTGEPPDPDKIF